MSEGFLLDCCSHTPASKRGFSLVEIAFVLLLAGLVAGGAMKFFTASNRNQCYEETRAKLERLRVAVNTYAQSNDRFPMPAQRILPADDKEYGREVPLDAGGNVDTTKLDEQVNGDGTVMVMGAFPFSTVRASAEDATDCWGNKLSYVVTKDLTDKNKFIDIGNPPVGAFNIKTDPTQPDADAFLKGAGFAIISHGMDGLGAVKANEATNGTGTFAGAAHRWCELNAAQLTTERSKRENCDLTNNTLVNRPYNDGKAAANDYFDDLIAYRGKPWKMGGGNVYCWGNNNTGGLGRAAVPANATSYQYYPQKIDSSENFIQLTDDGRSFCGLTESGKVYCWGNTRFAGGPSNAILLHWDGSAGKATKLYGLGAGQLETGCLYTDQNKLHCWGYNKTGQFGNGTMSQSTSLPSAGTYVQFIAPPLSAAETIVDVSAITEAYCALTSLQKVYCWGRNLEGQVGAGFNPAVTQELTRARVVVKSAPPTITFTKLAHTNGMPISLTHMCAIGTDTKTYCWGSDQYGQLGNTIPASGTGKNTFVATPIDLPVGVTLSEVYVNSQYSCGISTTKEAYCWGNNAFGQTGTGLSTAVVETPTAVAAHPTDGVIKFIKLLLQGNTTCGISEDLKTYCWGMNVFGQAGDGDVMVNKSIPSTVVGGPEFIEFATASGAYSCGVTKKGKLWCWGSRASKSMGDTLLPTRDNPAYTDTPVPIAGPSGTLADALSFRSIVGNANIHCGILGKPPLPADAVGWSDWSACSGGCGVDAGTQNRTCSGTCTGNSSRSCTPTESACPTSPPYTPAKDGVCENLPHFATCTMGFPLETSSNCAGTGWRSVQYVCKGIRGGADSGTCSALISDAGCN